MSSGSRLDTGPGPPDRSMRFLVAWDGSELSTLALRVAINVLSRKGDQLLVYRVTNRGRYGASDEFEVDVLQEQLAEELQGAPEGLRILKHQQGLGLVEEVDPAKGAPLTVDEKGRAEAVKISRRIVEFAALCHADVLVMGSVGNKAEDSATFQQTNLGSSAHLAALQAPCSVVLIRPGCRVDSKLATVYMVAVDGSHHALHALRMCTEMAKEKDEIVCHVFGPPDFTEPVEEQCTGLLQELMSRKKVEYAVIPTELSDSAGEHGDELAETARQCRFKQQAFLVFGALGRTADSEAGREGDEANCLFSPAPSPCTSPCASPFEADPRPEAVTLGRVARWCIHEAPCSLIIARPRSKQLDVPIAGSLYRAASAPVREAMGVM